MSIYPLLLDGWDDTSTWGEDRGQLYAQLTRNGVSDDNGPEFWITPPRYPRFARGPELANLMERSTACGHEAVLRGMAIGATVAGASRRRTTAPRLARLSQRRVVPGDDVAATPSECWWPPSMPSYTASMFLPGQVG